MRKEEKKKEKIQMRNREDSSTMQSMRKLGENKKRLGLIVFQKDFPHYIKEDTSRASDSHIMTNPKWEGNRVEAVIYILSQGTHIHPKFRQA